MRQIELKLEGVSKTYISPHQFYFGGRFITNLDEKAQLKDGDRIALLEGAC